MGDSIVLVTVVSAKERKEGIDFFPLTVDYQENDTDVLALTGASAALQVSNVPFSGPIAGVRVGRIDGQLVVNPSIAQRAACELGVIMAASEDAIGMVEGGAAE